MRVTFQSQFRDTSAGIESASQAIIDAQRQVTTGKKVNKPSDDPIAAANSSGNGNRSALGQYSESPTASDRARVVDTC